MRKPRIVEIDLSEIIEAEDHDHFLDIIEDEFFARDDKEDRGILEDILYKVVGATKDGKVRIEVTGTLYKADRAKKTRTIRTKTVITRG